MIFSNIFLYFYFKSLFIIHLKLSLLLIFYYRQTPMRLNPYYLCLLNTLLAILNPALLNYFILFIVIIIILIVFIFLLTSNPNDPQHMNVVCSWSTNFFTSSFLPYDIILMKIPSCVVL